MQGLPATVCLGPAPPRARLTAGVAASLPAAAQARARRRGVAELGKEPCPAGPPCLPSLHLRMRSSRPHLDKGCLVEHVAGQHRLGWLGHGVLPPVKHAGSDRRRCADSCPRRVDSCPGRGRVPLLLDRSPQLGGGSADHAPHARRDGQALERRAQHRALQRQGLLVQKAHGGCACQEGREGGGRLRRQASYRRRAAEAPPREHCSTGARPPSPSSRHAQRTRVHRATATRAAGAPKPGPRSKNIKSTTLQRGGNAGETQAAPQIDHARALDAGRVQPLRHGHSRRPDVAPVRIAISLARGDVVIHDCQGTSCVKFLLWPRMEAWMHCRMARPQAWLASKQLAGDVGGVSWRA